MTTNLFPSYRQRENQVTATFLAVLQRLSLSNINRILEALLDDSAFSLVSFENQPQGDESRPDAKIGTGRPVWIETKTTRGAVDHNQICRHLKSVTNGEKLLLLTPDDNAPTGLDDRVHWSAFNTLAGTIEEILEDDDQPPSEREAFLLREFISMLRKEGLVGPPSASRVMVVPAKPGHGWGWDMYLKLDVYRRSRDIRYRPSDYIAFYVGGKIQATVPKIKAMIESINIAQPEEVASLDSARKGYAEELLKNIEHHNYHEFGQNQFMVMFLSKPGESETVNLEMPIDNDKKDKNGKPWAFVLGGVRYVTLESLKKARTTSELELC